MHKEIYAQRHSLRLNAEVADKASHKSFERFAKNCV